MSARFHVWLLAACAVLAMAVPARASGWLYDCGPAIAGTIMKDGTSLERVSAPFLLKQEADVVTFGAILGRSYGPVGASVTVSLTTWQQYPISQVGSVLASEQIVPLSVTPDYYYVSLSVPIRLHANTWYSLVFVPDDPAFACNIGGTIKPGTYYSFGSVDDGASWFFLDFPACIRVGGDFVPEPASIAAVLVGLGALAISLRRTHHGE